MLKYIILGSALMFAYPAIAGPGNSDFGRSHHGAPGPLMAAGLPIAALAGGAWLLVRRFRRKN